MREKETQGIEGHIEGISGPGVLHKGNCASSIYVEMKNTSCILLNLSAILMT